MTIFENEKAKRDLEAHLISEDKALSVAGVTHAGLPGIIIGHNGHIAWGYTLSFVDTEDLVLEKINPDNERQYEFKGKWEDMVIVDEEFKVLNFFQLF